MEYGSNMSDQEYLREMARKVRENVGPPVEFHARRLDAIADRYDDLLRQVCKAHEPK